MGWVEKEATKRLGDGNGGGHDKVAGKDKSPHQSRTRVTDADWAPGRFRCGGWAKTASPFPPSCAGAGATAKVGWAAQRRPASDNSFVGMAATPGSVAGGPQPRCG